MVVPSRNRVAAFLLLERERILVIVIAADESRTYLNAFCANFLQPDVPKFEKYLAVKMGEVRYLQLTLAQFVANAGIAKSAMRQRMSFGGIPHEAMVVLADGPIYLVHTQRKIMRNRVGREGRKRWSR